MKIVIISFIFLSMISCQNETTKPQNNDEFKKVEKEQNDINGIPNDSLAFFEENLEFQKEKTKALKRDRLLKAEDDKLGLQQLVISKSFFKEEDHYILDYQYPYLNEKVDRGYSVFNNFMDENYLNIKKTENQILEDKELLCDTLNISRFRDKRIIDYKIYGIQSNLISVVLYKENYYSGMRHSTYLFDCLNFNLNEHEFIYFEDFFVINAEEEIYHTINAIIKENITSGEFYYDCWELSKGDFSAYKNNFVVNNNILEYYFDDCVICPSYTGTYSVEIPIKKIMHLIKKYNDHKGIGQ